jgi:hypothetical protein
LGVSAFTLTWDNVQVYNSTLIVQRMRSLAISLLRVDGQASIAAANRHHARGPQRTLKLRQTA